MKKLLVVLLFLAPLVSVGAITPSTWTRNSTSGYMYLPYVTDKVGIGTTTPLTALHINAASVPLTVDRNSGLSQLSLINLARQATSKWKIGLHSNDQFNIFDTAAGDTSVFTIQTGGNVGIGTTSPWKKLSLIGDFSLSGAIFDSRNASGTRGQILQSSGTTTVWADSPAGQIPVYNLKTSNMRNFFTAVASARAGSTTARILGVGDSTTFGSGGADTVVYPFNSYLYKMIDMLEANGDKAVYGLSVPPTNTNTDDRWSVGSTTWTKTSFGAGANSSYSETAGGTGSLTFTPRTIADTYSVYYIQYGSGGTIGVSAGGSATTSQSTAGTNSVQKVTVTAPQASASNVVQIAHTAGGNVHIVGVEAYLSTEKSIVLGNAGVAGSSASGWASAPVGSTEFGGIGLIKGYAPDLTIINLGINDAAASVSVATFKANIQSLITAAKLSGDVILLTMAPSQNAPTNVFEPQYVSALYDLADSNDIPLIDGYKRFGSAYNAEFMADSVHPNDTGYYDVAAIVSEALKSIISGGATNNRFITQLLNGNVGVGSSTPIAKLSVVGSTGSNPLVIASSTNQALLTIDQQGAVALNSPIVSNTSFYVKSVPTLTPFIVASSSDTALFSVTPTGGVTAIGNIFSATQVSAPTFLASNFGAESKITFNDSDTGTNWSSGQDSVGKYVISNGTSLSSDQKLTITPEGKVGIGTTTPTQALTVIGSTSISSSLHVGDPVTYTHLDNYVADFHRNIDDYMVVSIINTNPGENASADLLFNNDATTEAGNYFDIGFNSSNYNVPDYGYQNVPNMGYMFNDVGPISIGAVSGTSEGYIQFLTGGFDAEAARITNTGALGIGSTSPVARLVVTNPLSTQTVRFEDQAGDPTPFIIDASGNVGIGTPNPGAQSEKLYVNGDIMIPNTRTRTLTRTLPTTVGSYVDIGSFTFTNGAANLEIWVTIPSNGYAQSKRYIIPAKYSGTVGAWQTVQAISSTGAYLNTQDADLEINSNNATTSLRLRRTAGTIAGTAYVTLIQQGVEGDVFTASTSTGTTTAPTAIYEVFADAFLASRMQILSTPTDLGSYSLTNWGSTGQKVSAFIKAPSVSGSGGGSTILPTEPALILGRSGIQSTTYPNFAEFKIGRYEHSGASSRTRLDIALTHGNGQATGTDIMSLRSDGRVGIGETAPGSFLSVSGSGSFGASYDTTAAPTNGLIVEGKVAFGTSTATYPLNIQYSDSGANPHAFRFNNTASGGGSGYMGYTATGATIGANKFYFSDNSLYRFVIDGATGNIGFGTTTPTTNLHVTSASANATTTLTVGKAGQTKGTCMEVYTPSGTTVYVVASSTSPYGFERVGASCK